MFLFVLFFSLNNSYAGILFQDDFESDSSSWSCGSGQLSKWSAGYMSCGNSAGFGDEFKMGPGHNGNNAVYAWKSSSIPNGYRTESERWFSGAELSKEIYHRWYMKMPNNFDKQIAEGFKFWRYLTRENGYSNPPELYLNARGGTLGTGNLTIYNVATGYKDLMPISSFNDGAWHSHELRIKLNSDGQSDGILQYWLDGVLKTSYTNLSFGSATNMKIHRLGVGIGNVSDSPWFMSNWTAVAYDDVVVSTAYVGPTAGTAPATLKAPTNLRILNK